MGRFFIQVSNHPLCQLFSIIKKPCELLISLPTILVYFQNLLLQRLHGVAHFFEKIVVFTLVLRPPGLLSLLAQVNSLIHVLVRLVHQVFETIHDLPNTAKLLVHRSAHFQRSVVECIVRDIHPLVQVRQVRIQASNSAHHVVLYCLQGSG